MQLDWTANRWSNCCYAAAGLAWGLQPADSRLAAALHQPARELHELIGVADLPAREFWRNTLAVAHQSADPYSLARLALRKTGGAAASETLVARFGRSLAELETATADALPRFDQDLQHRARPLEQHWEARGPGLLKAIGQLTDPRLLVEQATIVED